MSGVRDTIDQFVASRLSHLVWGREYPVHPDIALDCVTKAFRDCGFDVKPNRDVYSVGIYYNNSFVNRPYDDILGGWWFLPKGSPTAISKNIEDICSQTVPLVAGVRYQPMVLSVTELFTQGLYRELLWFQEHALLPVTHIPSLLQKPALIERVLSYYSVSQLAEIFFKGDISKRMDNGELSESIENNDLKQQQDRLWAGYLQRLAEEKGYDVKYNKTNCHELQNNWLALGSQIF